MYYGERGAAVKDPVGNHGYIATHTEDLSSEELVKREAAFVNQ
jgi:PhnB protein